MQHIVFGTEGKLVRVKVDSLPQRVLWRACVLKTETSCISPRQVVSRLLFPSVSACNFYMRSDALGVFGAE